MPSILQSRVRAVKDDDEFAEFSESATDASDQDVASRQAGLKSRDAPKPKQRQSDEGESAASSESEGSDQNDNQIQEPVNPIAHISFGALASAQTSLGRKRKRELVTSTVQRTSRSPSPFHEAQERQEGKKKDSDSLTRNSKHAPAVQSSKKAVSRKRTVVHVPATGARDPRFSSLSGNTDEQRIERNYEFLNDYRKDELATLQKELRETRNTVKRDELKRLVRAMEDRERARKAVDMERAVRQEHRRQEREKVSQGKKPYFLKQSEVKKKIYEKEFEELGPKKAEKRMERRRKKVASKERKNMPDARRELGGAGL